MKSGKDLKLIVDTNRVFAALVRDGASRNILFHLNARYFTVLFLEEEIMKYKDEIIRKANISEREFFLLFEKIKSNLAFLGDSVVAAHIKEAYRIMKDIDQKDTPFIAAALATNADIWSDDRHFEKQTKVKVWKTSDLVKLL